MAVVSAADAADRLAAAVEQMLAGGAVAEFLRFSAKFRTYSWANRLLIWSQCPQATRVAGFHTWRSLGRWVRKGEHGIAIWAPVTQARRRVNENGEEATVRICTGFRVVYVWDVSQTEGKPLPALPETRLAGGGSYEEALYTALRSASPVPVREAALDRDGQFDSAAGRILIRADLDVAAKASTLIHELAHALAHGPGGAFAADDHVSREVVAEGAAYVVGQRLGLDSLEASATYVSRWARDPKVVRDQLSKIIATSERILALVEPAPDATTVA